MSYLSGYDAQLEAGLREVAPGASVEVPLGPVWSVTPLASVSGLAAEWPLEQPGTPHLGRYLRDFAGLTLAAGTQDILEVNLGAGVLAHGPAPATRDRQESGARA